MPVSVSCATLLVIHAYLGPGPDQSYARVSISVEHYILTIGDLPYTPEGHISQETHRAAAVRLPVRFYLGPGLEEVFMGPFRFAIDRVIYQEEKEKGPGSLIYQQKVAFLGGREDGYVPYICLWNS